MNIAAAFTVARTEISALLQPSKGIRRVIHFTYVGAPRIFNALLSEPTV